MKKVLSELKIVDNEAEQKLLRYARKVYTKDQYKENSALPSEEEVLAITRNTNKSSAPGSD